MYLLIRHDGLQVDKYIADLHSIMYLLIPIQRHIKQLIKQFTFHNVSINSNNAEMMRLLREEFTFHNVSINSSIQLV